MDRQVAGILRSVRSKCEKIKSIDQIKQWVGKLKNKETDEFWVFSTWDGDDNELNDEYTPFTSLDIVTLDPIKNREKFWVNIKEIKLDKLDKDYDGDNDIHNIAWQIDEIEKTGYYNLIGRWNFWVINAENKQERKLITKIKALLICKGMEENSRVRT